MFPVSVLADQDVPPTVRADVIQPRDLVKTLEADIVTITGVTRGGVPRPTMNSISLELAVVLSPGIMADSVGLRQVLITRDEKPGWRGNISTFCYIEGNTAGQSTASSNWRGW